MIYPISLIVKIRPSENSVFNNQPDELQTSETIYSAMRRYSYLSYNTTKSTLKRQNKKQDTYSSILLFIVSVPNKNYLAASADAAASTADAAA
ncbi:MAG: hypothetical protein Q4D63_00030, partial [Neisseria animaloris]|nr:hypothetical protein [Neisseria animaloris]